MGARALYGIDIARCGVASWLPATLRRSPDLRRGTVLRDDLPASVWEFQPLVSALDRLPLEQRVAGRDRLIRCSIVNAKTVLPNFILTISPIGWSRSLHRRARAVPGPPCRRSRGARAGEHESERHPRKTCSSRSRQGRVDPEVYDRQKHPFTTPPTRNTNDPMLAFYRDTFASQAAKDQPIYDMKKVSAALDQLLECPVDQRIAVEGGLQRVASIVLMQELFSMA